MESGDTDSQDVSTSDVNSTGLWDAFYSDILKEIGSFDSTLDGNEETDNYECMSNDGGDEKLAEFLIIKSLIEKEGSKRSQNESDQRQLEAESFMRHCKKTNFQSGRLDIKNVKSFEDMLVQIKDFVKGSDGSLLPTVLFLGHGCRNGDLCFLNRGSNDVPIKTAVKEIARTFRENRPSGMASSQLRVIFSQCYGHEVEPNKEQIVKGEVREDPDAGIELVYVTDKNKRKSTSWLTYDKPDIQQVEKIFDRDDIYLELPIHHTKLKSAVRDLKTFTDADERLKSLTPRPNYKKWLQKVKDPESSGRVPEELTDKVRELRKSLIMFLHLRDTESCSFPWDRSMNEVHDERYESEKKLKEKIDHFLQNEAQGVEMPVVVVEGKLRVEAELLVLHTTGGPVNVAQLHAHFKALRLDMRDDQLRFVFYCRDKDLWFSNAKLPNVKASKNIDLLNLFMAGSVYKITGDGPLNKVLGAQETA